MNIIIQDFLNHIKKCGGNYFDWYLGISKDAENRLFNEHRVRRESDAWIFRKANSSNEARTIEDYFVKSLGTDGDTGGGDYTSDMVYAYKKAYHTNP